MKFDTSNLGDLGNGGLILAGLLVLAMVIAGRSRDDLTQNWNYRKAGDQVAAAIFMNVILYIVPGFYAIFGFGKNPIRASDTAEIQAIMFIMVMTMIIEILFLTFAVRNLFKALARVG